MNSFEFEVLFDSKLCCEDDELEGGLAEEKDEGGGGEDDEEVWWLWWIWWWGEVEEEGGSSLGVGGKGEDEWWHGLCEGGEVEEELWWLCEGDIDEYGWKVLLIHSLLSEFISLWMSLLLVWVFSLFELLL